MTPKEILEGCIGLVILVLVVAFFKGCFSGTELSKSELKNPPVALEKLAREAFKSEPGIESIKVETMGPEENSYSIHVTYRAHFVLNHKATFNSIKVAMQRGYETILKYPQLPVSYIKIAAQLKLQDKYGNEGFEDVYRTQISFNALQKLNRKNLESVSFETLWEVVYLHPIFSSAGD